MRTHPRSPRTIAVRILTLSAIVCSLSGVSCKQRPLPPVDPIPVGVWRVALESPGGELPFFLELGRDGDQLVATLINGQERVTSTDVSMDGRNLEVDFPAFNSRIRVSIEDGFLVGSMSVVKGGGTRQMMPLRATKGRTSRFSPATKDPAVDVTGRWDVSFREPDGTETPAVGEFEQNGARLTGTFLTPTGDYRFLAGDVTGNRIRLSSFDGYHAFLFDAYVDSDGIMRGDFWSGTSWHETFEALRDESAALPDADALTYLKPGYVEFNFAFPDTTGMLVSLADPRFRDKVVVVSVSATWCPNCHDEAAFWAPFYLRNRERGFEMVALMFEHLEDFEDAARQVAAFARRHDIEYPLLIAGTSNKEEARKTLPMLNHVMAYPTTLFIDRGGHVRKIHTGFAGPGTGSHHRELIREFADYVDFLLREEPE